MTAYFSVKGWEKHQHYKDRAPPWIKLHVALLEDYEFGCLQDASKAHLLAIWLLASKHDNRIPLDPVWVGRRINATDPVDLGALVDAGFLLVEDARQAETPTKTTASQPASDPLAERSESARPETENRDQKEKIQKAAPSAGPTPPTPPPDDRPLDLKAEIWRRGKLFLARSGVPEPRAGPMIGRWRRDHGDGPVLDAMTRAEAECASEVVPFIEACLKGKSRHGPQRHDDPAAQRSAFDAGLAAAALRRMDPGR